MKKFLIVLTIFLSFIGISSVKAADLTITSRTDLDKFHEMFTDEEFSNNINTLINEYKEKYYYSHPYYLIHLNYSPYGLRQNGYSVLSFNLYYFNELPELKYDGVGSSTTYYHTLWIKLESSLMGSLHKSYKSTYKGIISSSQKDTLEGGDLTSATDDYYLFTFNKNANPKYYEVKHFYYSNFDLTLNSLNKFSEDSFLFEDYENILVPNVSDPTIYTVLSLSSDNLDYHFENLYDYDDKYNTDIFPSSYTEINLNDYSYVALALKDYNQNTFSTNVQVKGQYCLTPVYNYGLTERKDILEGTQVDRCSPYYDNYTTVRTSILTSDLQNHAIYYLKAYDTSKDNYVKIDTTVFDVTLITEEEKDNPYVMVNGKTYPTIPYDELTDTATKSEDEGYIPGASEEFNFSDIFTAPLDFLMEIWSTITTFFTLITSFIALLPPILQNFLYASFMLAIALGLIKIIL